MAPVIRSAMTVTLLRDTETGRHCFVEAGSGSRPDGGNWVETGSPIYYLGRGKIGATFDHGEAIDAIEGTGSYFIVGTAEIIDEGRGECGA